MPEHILKIVTFQTWRLIEKAVLTLLDGCTSGGAVRSSSCFCYPALRLSMAVQGLWQGLIPS